MIYKALIEVYIDVENAAEACDAIGEILREQTRSYIKNSCFIDWGYLPPDYPIPVPASAQEIAQLGIDS